MPSVRVSVALLVAVTTGLAVFWWRYYVSLLDYCEAENGYLGRSGLDCLEPPHWFAVNGMLVVSALVEIGGAVVVSAALMQRRKRKLTEA